MRIATYNVNSLRAREERVLDWLDATKPDVVCLQELKLEEDSFPRLVFDGLGYASAVLGQKTYNGVAILSKTPLTDVTRGFGDGEPDEQARFITAKTRGITFMSAYFPNGEALGSEKYRYKIRWIERLEAYLRPRLARGESIVIAGDYNIAPADIDTHAPLLWKHSVLSSPDERAAFARLLELGLTDVVRRVHPEAQLFSWWDYRSGGFEKNRGLRIDHLLVSGNLVPRIVSAGVDREARKTEPRGAKTKLPSDHAPVWAEITDDP